MSESLSQSGAGHAPRGIGELFAAHRARVYQWACAMGLSHDEGLDVVQEAFSRMMAARPVCPSEGAQLAWLRRTASNLAVDTRRGPRARVVGLPDAIRGRETPGEPDDAERARLRAALSSLTELQRLVLLAKVVDGHTFAQIAGELGVAPATAKTHYARALANLRGIVIGVGGGIVGEGPREGVRS